MLDWMLNPGEAGDGRDGRGHWVLVWTSPGAWRWGAGREEAADAFGVLEGAELTPEIVCVEVEAVKLGLLGVFGGFLASLGVGLV